MTKIFMQRLILLGPVVLATLTLVFVLTLLVPGDAATFMAGLGATEEGIQALREDMGLADPIPVQYARYVGNALRGNFGRSLHTNEPVLRVVLKRLGASIQLAVAGMIVAIVMGIPVGIVSALRQNSWLDHIITVALLALYSAPAFWFALLLMLIFALQLGWLPSTGVGGWRHLVLPG